MKSPFVRLVAVLFAAGRDSPATARNAYLAHALFEISREAGTNHAERSSATFVRRQEHGQPHRSRAAA